MNGTSIDIRDICYFVDHVKNLDLRISLIKSLGYRIGVDIVDVKSKVKNIKIGKRGETRIQITPCYKGTCIAKCAIVGNIDLQTE